MLITYDNHKNIIKDLNCDEINEIENLEIFIKELGAHTLGHELLVLAVEFNKIDVAKLLLAKGARVNTKLVKQLVDPIFQNLKAINTPESEAKDNDVINMLKLFLGNGINISDNIPGTEETLLSYAVHRNRPQIVNFLLLSGAQHKVTNPDPAYANILDYAERLCRMDKSENENQQLIISLLKNHEKYNLIENTLRHDRSSFFSQAPLDILQYVLRPMLTN